MHSTPGQRPLKLAVLGSGSRSPELPPHLAELASAEAVPVLYTTRLAAFAGNPYDRLVVDLAYVDMAQRAEAAGCAALFINTCADYGIDAMRAAVSIPVIGAGENAMAIGAEGGRKYSIVTIWPPSMTFLYDERLRACAAGQDCLKLRHVSAEDELQRLATEQGVQERMARGEAAIIDRIVLECERAIAEDGAQAIVLGCTCMAPVGPQIAARVGVPVVEGSRAGYLATLAAARQPPAAHPGPRTGRASLIPSIIDAYVDAHPDARSLPALAECPVCVF